jgi:homoserine kinase type II
MAVYTHVSDEALRDFLAHYDVGEVLSFKGIAEGVENSNYLLKTTQSTFILTLFEKRVDEKDLPFFLGLMEHVAKRGVSCATAIAARDSQLTRTLNGRPAALISFLDGLSIRKPTPSHCGAVGQTLAEFHEASSDFSLVRPNGLGQQDWRPIYEKCQERADEIEPGLGAFMEQELTFLDQAWPADLPQGVIHADLFPDNVFFLSNKLSGIIDFYFACNDIRAYDLACCLNAWCFDDACQFDLKRGEALLSAYQGGHPLNPNERQALPVLCRGSAMRFLVTRLYDWLHHEQGALVAPKDPRDYVSRLKFHQKVTSASDYGLS